MTTDATAAQEFAAHAVRVPHGTRTVLVAAVANEEMKRTLATTPRSTWSHSDDVLYLAHHDRPLG